jgi:glycerol-3-phosphate cytidylyltransferase
MITGFTAGAFDLLHAGHVLMLKEASEVCDHLVVGLHTDPSTDRPEKNKPIQSVEERMIQLQGCRYVDSIEVYETEDDLYRLLSDLQPDVRILGSDWKNKQFTGHDLDIPIYFNNRDHDYSSSSLRDRITGV